VKDTKYSKATFRDDRILTSELHSMSNNNNYVVNTVGSAALEYKEQFYADQGC